MYRCVIHHPEGELHLLAQNCRFLQGCYIRCVIKYKCTGHKLGITQPTKTQE